VVRGEQVRLIQRALPKAIGSVIRVTNYLGVADWIAVRRSDGRWLLVDSEGSVRTDAQLTGLRQFTWELIHDNDQGAQDA
jgi:hypothetical protein